MANSPLLLSFLLLLLFIQVEPQPTSTSTSFKTVPLAKRAQLRQKLSHLHFYFHDIVSGRNATAVPVTRAINTTSSSPYSAFGMITFMDDMLTEGPEPNSTEVGRAQGLYAGAALEDLGFLQAMNLYFTTGKYNGSVLTVLGRNAAMHPLREMPVVGGSGLFRFATGYALARTHWIDLRTGDAIVEYNVTVMHY